MRASRRRWAAAGAAVSLWWSGCQHDHLVPPPVSLPPAPPPVCHPLPACGAKLGEPVAPRAEAEPQAIDLATALKLADAQNPSVAFARERVREALAQVDRA